MIDGVSVGTSGDKMERIECGERVAMVPVEGVRSDPAMALMMMKLIWALLGIVSSVLTRSQARKL